MSDYGISVGSNVVTNTDLELQLTSKYSSQKLYKWGDTSFTTNGSRVGSVTIPHDLGYAPIVEVYRKTTAQYTFLSATTYPNAFMDARMPNAYGGTDNNVVAVVTTSTTSITISSFPIADIPITGGPQANTTYNFRYMIFVDKSQAFSGKSNIALTGDYGFKIAKEGKDVTSAEEYDMAYSSKYKAVQFYDQLVMSSSLTLPEMFATPYDTSVGEATYVDFNHNLGYAPHFVFFVQYGTDWVIAPILQYNPSGPSDTIGYTELSAWSDATRVRVLFHRESYTTGGLSNGATFSATTYNIRIVIFTINLAGEANG